MITYLILIISTLIIGVVLSMIILNVRGGRLKKAILKLAFLPDGSFSITRLIMVAVSFSGIALIWIGVVAALFYGKELPNNLYTYVGSLMGGGIVQYGFTKLMINGNNKKEENDVA